jgi:hypothetical protein
MRQRTPDMPDKLDCLAAKPQSYPSVFGDINRRKGQNTGVEI